MMVQPDYEGVQDEFGLPRPNFLDEELAQSRRLQAANRGAEEAVETAKKILGGEGVIHYKPVAVPAGTATARFASKWAAASCAITCRTWLPMGRSSARSRPTVCLLGSPDTRFVVAFAPMSVRRALAANGCFIRPRSTSGHRPLSPGGVSLQEWLDAFTLASGTRAPWPNW